MKRYILIALVLTVITGCAKVPDEVLSPSIRVESTVTEDREVYTLNFSGGIPNENKDVVLSNVKGDVVLFDPAQKNGRSVRLSFEIPVILPFDTGIIDIHRDFSEKEILSLVDILNIDREEFFENRGIDNLYIDEKNIVLDDLDYRKENIITVLKRKVK